MLNLLIKDFKLMFGKEKSLATRVITGILSVVFVACFIALEVFLFSAVLQKIKIYKNAPQAFTTLFLFVISVLMIISSLFQAKKLFFNEKDLKQLANFPVSNGQVILSKLIFLFFSHYATCFIFIYPLFVAYGTVFAKTALYYYFALFYPVFSFFFEMGIALIFVYPLWLLLEYLKKRLILKFVLALVLLLGGTFIYAEVLNVFIDLIANNQLSTIFSSESIAKLIVFEKYAIPINFLKEVFINRSTRSLFPYLCISIGIFSLGLSIAIFTFHYVRNLSFTAKSKEKEPKFKKMTPVQALIKKEIILLVKQADYVFSFTGLLIIQPCLLYLIVKAMNAIFSAGLFKYYLSIIPDFTLFLDIFLIIMFTLIINQGANSYITMEDRTIKNMKTIPISYKTQLLIKTLIPFSLSVISLFISLVVLVAFGTLSVVNALIALLFAVVCLFVFDVISLKEELSIRRGVGRKSYLSSIYAYLLPILYIAVAILLSFVGAPIVLIYLAGFLVLSLFGLPHLLSVYKNMGSLFMDLEAIN